MNFRRTLVLTVAIYTSICMAHAAGFWLHVHVQEEGKAESVKVNVPVSLIEMILPVIEEEGLEQGRIHFDDRDLTVQQLREIWAEVQAQGDYELASIDSDDTRVRVALEGNDLLVRSTEGSETEVLVRVPKQFVDALLSGTGDQINVTGAIAVLKTLGAQELVNVRDDDTKVRVWIDESSSSLE